MSGLLWVMVGGGIGAGARYLLTGVLHSVLGTAFPYGTLACNLLGSFLLVVFAHTLSARGVSLELRLLLTTGLMGGFTTYSTFNLELLTALEAGAYRVAMLNLTGTVLGCLLGGMLALILTRQMPA